MPYRPFRRVKLCLHFEIGMTNHTFSDPLAAAFQRLNDALQAKASAPVASDSDAGALVADLTKEVEALREENASLKDSLRGVEAREAEIVHKLDAAIAQLDVAIGES